jgi:hypothetical protein
MVYPDPPLHGYYASEPYASMLRDSGFYDLSVHDYDGHVRMFG